MSWLKRKSDSIPLMVAVCLLLSYSLCFANSINGWGQYKSLLAESKATQPSSLESFQLCRRFHSAFNFEDSGIEDLCNLAEKIGSWHVFTVAGGGTIYCPLRVAIPAITTSTLAIGNIACAYEPVFYVLKDGEILNATSVLIATEHGDFLPYTDSERSFRVHLPGDLGKHEQAALYYELNQERRLIILPKDGLLEAINLVFPN